jgi:hypothetical protein
MTSALKTFLSCFLISGLLMACNTWQEGENADIDLASVFTNPSGFAKPWVFWYWMKAAVSKEGITADLQAMKEAGIEGAYLMPIMGKTDDMDFKPAAVQLSPQWWKMVKFAFEEAKRLNIKLALHACDGFALSGGPWIKPEMSMQKLVWTITRVRGGKDFSGKLRQPETNESYYSDIAVFALPLGKDDEWESSCNRRVKISSNTPVRSPDFLNKKHSDEVFKSSNSCWIQYEFKEPFVCRSVVIKTKSKNLQSQRLIIQFSDDGIHYQEAARLVPPRHGWQDEDIKVSTHSIKPVKAKFFRFLYNPAGTEPGSEDLEAGKWKQSLKISGIELSGLPRINQFEGKNGSVWRVGKASDRNRIPDSLCIIPDDIVNVTDKMDADGTFRWDVPAGDWLVLRMGHTSTGHTNYTGGGALGLESDKFNSDITRFQYNKWFKKIIQEVGPNRAHEVLRGFHVDSWECGSQNWSSVFPGEFKKRRGYDIIPLLPVMAGFPLQSAGYSEEVLHDVRETITELVMDNFFGVYAQLAHKDNCWFSAESTAPTMLTDAMRHYGIVDIPMGEFWMRSPTHDKPNDMLDAVSGGHIYGKNIIQAEAFTELRIYWDEHPGMLKKLADLQFSEGANRMVYHVYTHNPWLDRKPGMTLNGVGNVFQRDQTWWKQGKAWNTYIARCQALLQQGKPVTDIAVFTGEELPRRSVLPDRLVSTLPGIFGKATTERERERLHNEGNPEKEMPEGVRFSANTYDTRNWIDPLRGYKYDSFNPDVLYRLAKVENGKIVLPSGNVYSALIVPGQRRLNPTGNVISSKLAKRFIEMANDGATIIFRKIPEVKEDSETNNTWQDYLSQKLQILADSDGNECRLWKIGKGTFIEGPCLWTSFDPLGVFRDFYASPGDGTLCDSVAWTHRRGAGFDIYFVSNQSNSSKQLNLSFRTTGKIPQIFNPVTSEIFDAGNFEMKNGRTNLPVEMSKGESLFFVFSENTGNTKADTGDNRFKYHKVKLVEGPWNVAFNPVYDQSSFNITLDELKSWTESTDANVKYYSGTAAYETSFNWNAADLEKYNEVWLNPGEVDNIAEVLINDKPCGISWTSPYRVNISDALRVGSNKLTIKVTNTWANRIIGDQTLPEKERKTWTMSPWNRNESNLLTAGLLGPVVLETKE